MSRQQDFMRQALLDTTAVKNDSNLDRDAYTSLCHQIPSLVLNDGLGLTVAFLEHKKSGNDQHHYVLKALRTLLGATNHRGALSTYLTQDSRRASHYMLDTFTVLDGWVFYKRFAESMLDEAETPASGNAVAP